MNARLRALAVLLTVVAIVPADAPARTTSSSPTLGPARDGTVVKELRFGQSRLLVSFAPGEFRLSEQDFLDWVLRSARATATFFGRFPVAEVRISLEATSGEYIGDGIAWASPGARIRIGVGRNITARTLKGDSTLVHEMTHLGFPDLDEAHLWLHEGIATYVEDIARAEAGETTAAAVWAHFVDEMPQGLPERGDKGLNDTPSHDRRYWGGAMFCLVADVEIRRRTHNRFGLKHALRAVLEAGGTLQGYLGDRARARDRRPRGRRAGAERAVPDVEGEVGGARPRPALGQSRRAWRKRRRQAGRYRPARRHPPRHHRAAQHPVPARRPRAHPRDGPHPIGSAIAAMLQSAPVPPERHQGRG